MAVARAPFLVQDGSFHRSSNIKNNGLSFWSIARKINHLSKHFTIARWQLLSLERHFDLHVQKVHFAWLPRRLRDGPFHQAMDNNVYSIGSLAILKYKWRSLGRNVRYSIATFIERGTDISLN
jgi:hypothetical protein